jgi:hypothetical protein
VQRSDSILMLDLHGGHVMAVWIDSYIFSSQPIGLCLHGFFFQVELAL